jgi:hypothetical protein
MIMASHVSETKLGASSHISSRSHLIHRPPLPPLGNAKKDHQQVKADTLPNYQQMENRRDRSTTVCVLQLLVVHSERLYIAIKVNRPTNWLTKQWCHKLTNHACAALLALPHS